MSCLLRLSSKIQSQSCNVLSFAIIMDPRYKVKSIEYCLSKLEMATEVRDEKVEDIVECLYELYNEYEFRFGTHTDPLGAENENVNEGDTVDELDELGGFESFRSCFRGVETSEKSELTMYLEEPEILRKTKIDVLQYWKEKQARYPRLAFMARDLLSVQITTVAFESSFIIGGRI
nr:zinc finger BED domain-containing protein RICESLEEPER 2-like [Tanacetum cinerariifolium]